jgi:hypothetical protein
MKRLSCRASILKSSSRALPNTHSLRTPTASEVRSFNRSSAEKPLATIWHFAAVSITGRDAPTGEQGRLTRSPAYPACAVSPEVEAVRPCESLTPQSPAPKMWRSHAPIHGRTDVSRWFAYPEYHSRRASLPHCRRQERRQWRYLGALVRLSRQNQDVLHLRWPERGGNPGLGSGDGPSGGFDNAGDGAGPVLLPRGLIY